MADNVMSTARWAQFWEAYKAEPQQKAGIEQLRTVIASVNPSLLTENASWAQEFRKTPPKAPEKLIWVPYFNQLQMADGEGFRDCFSATCAMIAAWKGKVKDENVYNKLRQAHGDSTVAASQIGALRDLGLTAHYGTTGTKAMLCSLIDRGIPVGTGILHHGQVSSPTGGGHWMLVVGYNEHGVLCNDPYGELNVVSGTWVTQGSGGNHVTYSWKNWLPRWEVAGGDGYYLWAE